MCSGLKSKNLNVVFSGAASLEKALSSALQQQAKALEHADDHTACAPRDERMCNRLVKDRQGNEGMSREDVMEAVQKNLFSSTDPPKLRYAVEPTRCGKDVYIRVAPKD